MLRYIIKRVLWMIPVMLGVLIVVFTITYFTPGDPVRNIVGQFATDEQYAAKAAQLGLDKGYFAQLGTYIWNIVTKFDFGTSFESNLPIKIQLMQRFPVSAQLGLMTVAFGLLFGIPLGLLVATHQYQAADYISTILALIFAAIPGFVLSLVGLIIFAVRLRWLPVGGLESFKSWILPVVTTGLPGIALMLRQTRTNMLEVIRQDYIRTARAKGLAQRTIIRKHAFRNCMIPIVTVVGGQVAFTLSGSLITENIFNIKGLGSYLYSGIVARDYPIINGCVLLIAFIVCVMNLLVDLSYTFIDPRIKAEFVGKSKRPKKVKANVNQGKVA